jgi:DNA-binding CsgD family transcriptional regulator
MEVRKITEFSSFLAGAPKSFNAIAQFLVMKTFREENFLSGIISELTEDGLTCPIAGFGWSQEVFDSFPNRQVTAISPITMSIRTNRIIFFTNDAELTTRFPDILMNDPGEWVSAVAMPVYPIGGMSFVSSRKLEETHEQEIFFTAIGSLLGLYASRLPTSLEQVAIKVRENIDFEQVRLTDRQLVIAGLLERGFTNSQIASEIGYSESLVRQETVSIYKKLNVTGREAMKLIRTLHLENLKIEESKI